MVITSSADPQATPDSPCTSLCVLVLDADAEQRDITVAALTRHGYSVSGAESAEALYEHPSAALADMVLIDLQLPGIDTLDLSARLRQTQPELGIVLLGSAHRCPDARVTSYRHGADLCLDRPATPAELCAALDALARRLTATVADNAPPLLLELSNCILHTPGGSLALRRLETEVLHALALAPGGLLENWQLLERLGKPLDIYGKSQLEVLISRLRSRLKSVLPDSNLIRAERGHGYRLNHPLQVRR